MADWYVSSAAWTAIPQFAISTAYTVGQIIRPLTAPAFNAQYAFRCTTAGTSAGSEPSWSGAGADGLTVTSGGATFTNVSGRSAHGWSAAAGNLFSMSLNAVGGTPRAAPGDRIFLSSDHSETTTSNGTYTLYGSNVFGLISVISVNRAGSVPPVAADYLAGATITANGPNLVLDNITNMYWQGITFTLAGTGNIMYFGFNGGRTNYLKNCAVVFTTSITTATIYTSNNSQARLIFDATTVRFNAAGQTFLLSNGGYANEFVWINTPSALPGTAPTLLFSGSGNGFSPNLVTCRGVDLSAVTGTLFYANNNYNFGKLLFDSCQIASGVTRLGTTAYRTSSDEVELVNCYDGTSFISERHTPAGDVTTEFTITLSGGATDNVGTFSHKMVSSSRSDKYAMTLDGFWMDVNNSTIGGPRTATIEIISSASLNNDDITLLIEYEGTSGSSIASFTSSFPNPLTTVAAITTSTATWNSSPATPVKQKLTVTFTPLVQGRVRGQVRLGKPSTTVYVDPKMVLS